MSCKKATASDVDRQHIALGTATLGNERADAAATSSDHRARCSTQHDAYELRSEPAADYAGNRIVSYCFSARPATLLHLPRRHSGWRRGPAVRAQGCNRGACEYKKFLKNSQV